MRIYLSASTAPSEAQRVQDALAALRTAGLSITSTWPDVIAKVGDANPRDASADERAGWALGDLQEVDDADAVWFLVPSSPATTRGAWIEVGYARAFGKPIVFSGDTKQSVFCALGHECESDADALAWLIGLASLEQDELAAMSPVPPLDAAPVDSIDLVREFHAAFGQDDADKPRVTDGAINRLRIALLREELDELEEALSMGHAVDTLDALTDLQYVLDGAYLQLGFASVKDAALAEVHRSNMTKLGADGRPVRRADGKIIKGPNYSPPDLAQFIHPTASRPSSSPGAAEAGREPATGGSAGTFTHASSCDFWSGEGCSREPGCKEGM